MNTFFKCLSLLVITAIFTSCVSMGKYQASLQERNTIQEENDKLKSDKEQLVARNEVLEDLLANNTEEKVQAETALSTRKAAWDQLQATIEEQQRKLETIRTSLLDDISEFSESELFVYQHDGEMHISVSQELLFPSGSAWVNSRGKKALKTLAKTLNANSDLQIKVEGHTDNLEVVDGNYLDNWDLSVSRATAVTRILTNDLQVNPQRITASGRSKYEPLMSNQSPEGRQKNRRIEIILDPNLGKIINQF